MRSQSKEDYIKAIYQIQNEQKNTWVSTSSLATHLGITSASVTGMVKRLAGTEPALVEYEPYSGVKLTTDGEKTALEVIRHHRLIETYLSRMLGYSWDEVHEEAERLEHVISEEMEERMASALGNPTTDPHGDPIPDREGNIPQLHTIELTKLQEGETAQIQRVTGQEPDLLRYLAVLGLVPDARVRVVSKAPFNGPVSIILEEPTRNTISISRELTDKIMVLPKIPAEEKVSDE
jgi:DtxR family transcriptional regulator, Mn-dependent transcriptional regulator